jgi:hypothetical protein
MDDFDLDFDIPERFKLQVLNNCVNPKIGKHIFDCAFKLQQKKLIELR